jgi:hypothetical protein
VLKNTLNLGEHFDGDDASNTTAIEREQLVGRALG